MIRYSVRINLADFIATPEEEKVIGLVYSIGEETNKKIFLRLWYRKDELSQEQIVKFVERYENILEDIGTHIHVGEHETWTQKSWFNIRKRGIPSTTDYRHECTYENVEGILRALTVFRTMVMKMDGIQAVSTPQNQKREETKQQNGYRVTIKKVPHVQ